MDLNKYPNYKEVMNYANGVIDGNVIANKDRIAACKRFLKDLKNPDYDFRPKDAEFVIGIIEKTMVHIKGPLKGRPFLLIPWEKFVTYNVAGFYYKDSDRRRFTESFIMVPRKNGKTPFAAGLAWGFSLLDYKYGSTVYLVGNSLTQALESFDILRDNIKEMGMDDEFVIHYSQNDHSIQKRFYGDKNQEIGFIKIKALASNPDAQDSFNCNYAICDEIHAYKKVKQYTLFKQAMKAYKNKHLFGITTAGDNINSFCYRRMEYCKKVVNGIIEDERYFVFICQADDQDDYTNPIEHEKANPSYGVTINPKEIHEASLQAQGDPSVRSDFLNKELNVYTSSMNAYFDIEEIRASDTNYNWTLDELSKLPIKWYGGADLSRTFDLTAAALYGEYKGVVIVITHGFMPIVQARIKAEEDNIPIFGWKDDGLLTLCNSEVVEYSDVVNWFLKMKGRGFKIPVVGFDRKFAREFFLLMKSKGFKIVDQPQYFHVKSQGFREIERRIKKKKFYYLHSEAYEYCISNVRAVEMVDDMVKYEKISGTQRIDLFDASVFACLQYLENLRLNQNTKEWF